MSNFPPHIYIHVSPVWWLLNVTTLNSYHTTFCSLTLTWLSWSWWSTWSPQGMVVAVIVHVQHVCWRKLTDHFRPLYIQNLQIFYFKIFKVTCIDIALTWVTWHIIYVQVLCYFELKCLYTWFSPINLIWTVNTYM